MTDTGQHARALVPVDEIITAARQLSRAGQWSWAAKLLNATTAPDARGHAQLTLAYAQVAQDRDVFCGIQTAAAALSLADQACASVDLDAASHWDLAFLHLRHRYHSQIQSGGRLQLGPAGKDLATIADIRRSADDLRDTAPDETRRGWAHMYRGLIADNLYGDRAAAPTHYAAALRVGQAGDPLLAREALRHLGDHDHDDRDQQHAFQRWSQATSLSAAAGAVPATLSQQMLLAVLARDAGDEAGATCLAREIARWAAALGATRLETQATQFLAGVDPTAAPDDKDHP